MVDFTESVFKIKERNYEGTLSNPSFVYNISHLEVCSNVPDRFGVKPFWIFNNNNNNNNSNDNNDNDDNDDNDNNNATKKDLVYNDLVKMGTCQMVLKFTQGRLPKNCDDLVKLGGCFHVSRELKMKVITKSFNDK